LALQHRSLHSFPTRRSSDLLSGIAGGANTSSEPSTRRLVFQLNPGPSGGKSSEVNPPPKLVAVNSWNLSPLARAVGPRLLTTSADRKSTRLNSSHRTISYAV